MELASQQRTEATAEQMIAEHLRSILVLLGEDPTREGLIDTPRRFAKALTDLTQGYATDLETIINGAVFTHAGSGLVIVRDIELFSLCEHHLLPGSK